MSSAFTAYAEEGDEFGSDNPELVGEDFEDLEKKYSDVSTVYDLENEVIEPTQAEPTAPTKDDSPGESDEDIYGDESFDEENALQLQDEYVIDEIVVKFKDPEQVPGMEDQLQREIDKVKKTGVVEMLGVYIINVADFEMDANEILNRFKNNKYVEYVEPNYVVEPELIPNDPAYATHQKLVLTAVGAQEGWDILTGSSAAIIAVVDSGVKPHVDLPPLLPGYASVQGLSPNTDYRNHGTGVAGTIGMVGNNAQGGAGYNWNASILPVKVDDASGKLTTSTLAKGIIWAADNGARVINLSVGTTANSSVLKNAIDYAYNKGCVLVAATGNDGKSTVQYPARYDNVIAVGAASSATARTPYSNYGTGINVVAVGGFYTTNASGKYATQSGTSFATPMVSALASMILTLDPSLTNEEVYRIIEQGATAPPDEYNIQVGYGMIHFGNTLRLVLDGRNEEEEEPDEVIPETPQIVWTAPTITLSGFANMTLEYGQPYIEAGYAAEDCKLTDITSSVVVTSNLNVWTAGLYTIHYEVTDSQGYTARATRTVTVDPEPEVVIPVTAPLIALNGSNPIVLHETSSTPYTEQGVRALDYDGTDISDRVVITGNLNREVAGSYTLTYTVTSPTSGLSASTTRVVRIVAPTESKEARTEYGISGLARKGGKVTYKGFLAEESGVLDLSVVSLTGGAQIQVELINTDTKLVALSETYTSAGTMQYRVPSGSYQVVISVLAASGIARFTLNILLPETISYLEDEIPLDLTAAPQIMPIGSNPIVLHVGGTPYYEQGARAVDYSGANLSSRVEIIGEPDTTKEGIYTVTYKVRSDAGGEATTTRTIRVIDPNGDDFSGEEEIPLAEPDTIYVVQRGDNLWKIAAKLFGDGNRWAEIYDMNRSIIGKDPDLIFPGQQLKVKKN